MKTWLTLILLIAGLALFRIPEARASHALNSSFVHISQANAIATLAMVSSNQALKVKNRKQATSLVKARYKAKVLSVSSAKVNGNPGYKAKLLGDNGTVFYVYIDAKTAQMKRS